MKLGGKKLKIGILTTFYNIDQSYSLCSIVLDQLSVLQKFGYSPVLFVHDNFTGDSEVPDGVEIRKVVPRFELIDYASEANIHEGFNEQVETTVKALQENMKDIDVCITHDIIFQGWFLPYNAAIRKLELPELKWLHWVHSAPSPRPELEYPHNLRFTIPDNSKIVYLNHTDVTRVAEMYGAWPKDVRVVHNPKDPRTFWKMHKLTEQLINKYGLLEKDIVDIYPLSTPRMIGGKQVNRVIQLMGKFKKLGHSVSLVVCNAHANDDKDKKLIDQMIEYGRKCGLDHTDLIFTSYEGKEYELGVPSQVVSELFRLSNVFIFPSLSENCSLVLLEAALSKNLLVLNESFKPMTDFFHENALYFKFGSLLENVNYENEERYFEDVAKIILSELKENKALNSFNTLKQKFNMDYIFTTQIEPLFYENYGN